MRRGSIVALALAVAACSPGPQAATSTVTTQPEMEPTTTQAPAPSTTSGPSTTQSVPTTTTTVGLGETVLAYRPVAELGFPVQMTARPGESVAYVITKDGRMWTFDGASVDPAPVLDISERVRDESEQGLLSIALHQTDQSRFYLHYSDNSGDTTVSEFRFDPAGVADPESERILLRVSQPARNHNGGMIQFTSAGTLILGLGDGGGADDVYGNGQNPDTLLGGLVEISVEGDPSPVKYATGLRNPWRFWLDEETLYLADVGQDEFEEVNVLPLAPGANFGWPIVEGLHCFSEPNCDYSDYVVPVVEIRHGDAGTCSVTGGIVYRGSSLPQLDGHYFYSDYCGGYLRSFLHDDGSATETRDWTEQVGVPGQVTGFGVDGNGELYVTTTNALLAVVPAG